MARNDSKTEGLDLNPDGTIDLVIDGVVRHLRRPKLREFRHYSERLRELAKLAQLEAVRLQEALAELSTLVDTDSEEADPRVEEIEKELEEANQKRLEYTAPWIGDLVEQFSEKPLPDDVEDWPSWLVLDLSIPAKILNHWRVVPLVPGKAGTN